MTEFSLTQEFDNLVKQTISQQEQTTVIEERNNMTDNDESAKNRDFFHDNNAIKKKKKKYQTVHNNSNKIKKFLSNISYIGITKEDFYNRNFVFNIYALVTKNVNPFSLERKISDFNKQEMNYMLQKECIPAEFYKYIWLEENFVYLNGKSVLYPKK